MGHAYDLGDAYLHKAMEWTLKGKPQAHHERLAAIMKALWLRAKIQSSFFSVLMLLNRSGLVSLEGLEKPMNLGRIEDETVMRVYAALYNFEKLKEIGDDWRNTFPNHEALDDWFTPMAGYLTPLDWLATLIVCGALITDFRVILDKIEDFEEFGALDRPRLENYIVKYCLEVKELVRNSNANISYNGAEPRPRDVDGAVVAFWLPYDLGANVTAETAYRDFDDKVFILLEDLFFRFFGLDKNSKLPNEMLPASMLQ
jgi:hypothetical protein